MARKPGRILDKVKDAVVLKKIRDAAKSGRVKFASQKKLVKLDEFVERVMRGVVKISKIPNSYFISDMSSIGDFPIEKKDLPKLKKMLGVKVDLDDYIIDVAKKLKDAAMAQ